MAQSPLIQYRVAVAMGNVDEAERLVGQHLDLLESYGRGKTPLMDACEFKDFKMS
jgi:hypothetical protein